MRSPVTRLKLAIVGRPRLKRRIKQLRYAGFQGLCRSLGPGVDAQTRILGYHTVGDGENDLSVSVAQFRRQIEWLVQHGYRIMTLNAWHATLAAGSEPAPRSVILTFDDGYRSVLTRAAPILAEFGAAGTVFVITDYVGKTNAYDTPFNVPELPLLSWDEIGRLRALGWDIQSHGRRHYPLVQLLPKVLDEEVRGSRRALERELGSAVDFFCYPYGAFDRATLEAVRQAGYAGGLTCWPGRAPASAEGDWVRLPRVPVDGLMPLSDFAVIFSPAYRRFNEAKMWLRDRLNRSECGFDELDQLRHLQVFRA